MAHICYFLHIINLIANSLVHESDINKKRRDRKPTRFFDENAKKISLKAGSMRLRDWLKKSRKSFIRPYI